MWCIIFILDAYDTTDMTLEWREKLPVVLNTDLELPQFDLGTVTTKPCLMQYQTGKGTYHVLSSKSYPV